MFTKLRVGVKNKWGEQMDIKITFFVTDEGF